MKKRYWFWVTTLLFLAGMMCSGGTLVAQAQEPDPPIIWPPDFDQLRIEYQRVNVTIDDQVATTHIDQLFVNEGDGLLEGSYFFPLPEGATVSQLTMWVDGIPIEAKILERDEARAIYDEIVRQLRDPALLEYVGSSAIQANIFPIPAFAERRIEIEYTQILPAENGLIHFIYPQSTALYTNSPLDNQNIRIELQSDEAIRTVYSPSHPVAIERDGDFQAVIGFEGNEVIADEDFELYYSVSPEEIGLSLLSYRETGQDGFFVLLAAPSVEVNEVVAKDVILVLDTSGSMEGEKLTQAKEAAQYVIEQLNPEDRFNIINFSTGMRSFAPELLAATEVSGVETYLNSLEALGGTNISLALLEAVNQADNVRPTTIIFMTDGLATEGITDTNLLVDSIGQAAPNNVRLFAFGVGDDVDTLLLDSLAQNHRGTTTYVRPFQSINEIVSAFYTKISTPVLADLSIDFGGMVVEQMYPQTLPDLFAGSQLVLVGRYRDGGAATITLNGTVNGEPRNFVYDDQFFRLRSGDDFIPRLWATRSIGHLLTQIRLHGENPELVQSVVNLSIRYGIITEYTSYLIEEDDIFTQAARDEIVETEMEAMAEEDADVSGSDAVTEAAAAGEMADSEVAIEFEATDETGQEIVQFVGSKTFVWNNGRWVDTTFDPNLYNVTPITFASDGYFDLLTAVPELANYFAIDPHVLVVFDSLAYEIVDSGGDENVQLPVTVVAVEPGTTAVPLEITVIAVETNDETQPLTITVVATEPEASVTPQPTPTTTLQIREPTDSNMIASATRTPSPPTGISALGIGIGWGIFIGVVGAILVLGAGVLIGIRTRE